MHPEHCPLDYFAYPWSPQLPKTPAYPIVALVVAAVVVVVMVAVVVVTAAPQPPNLSAPPRHLFIESSLWEKTPRLPTHGDRVPPRSAGQSKTSTWPPW